MDLPYWFMIRKVLFTDFGIDQFILITSKEGAKGASCSQILALPIDFMNRVRKQKTNFKGKFTKVNVYLAEYAWPDS